VVDVRNVITCVKFADDRLRGLGSAESKISLFTIDFDGRPYNTLTLPCKCVISYCFGLVYIQGRSQEFDLGGYKLVKETKQPHAFIFFRLRCVCVCFVFVFFLVL